MGGPQCSIKVRSLKTNIAVHQHMHIKPDQCSEFVKWLSGGEQPASKVVDDMIDWTYGQSTKKINPVIRVVVRVTEADGVSATPEGENPAHLHKAFCYALPSGNGAGACGDGGEVGVFRSSDKKQFAVWLEAARTFFKGLLETAHDTTLMFVSTKTTMKLSDWVKYLS